ncbi:MAG TPA: hypothetical protein PKE39_04425 [Ignavibacteria bacterium]|nr:hypothetical protein [Ignavibacteria bacterium]HMQ98248.1 hypothetical protein [Ignavibacteria bacterium]
MKKKSKKFLQLCKKYNVNPDEVREVLSVKQAFKLLNLDLFKMPGVSKIPKRFRLWLEWLYKMAVVTEAFNTDENGKLWIPNYNDSSEYKYEIWWDVKADKKHPSGSGLSYDVFVCWVTASDVPARLCFKNRDTAIFVGKHFAKEFKFVQLHFE